MAGTLLFALLSPQFGANIEPESDPGKILDALTPQPPADPIPLEGEALVSNLAFVPTANGVSVRAAQGDDMFTFTIPNGTSVHYKIFTAQGAEPLRVELKLLGISVPVPGLTRALPPDANGVLKEEINPDPDKQNVKLVMPSLVLAVTEKSAKLAPAQTQGGGLKVTMDPPFALIGPPSVLGFGFNGGATLFLDLPQGPEVRILSVQLFINPPAMPVLQMHGTAANMVIGMGATNGGITGDFTVQQDPGAVNPSKPDFIDQLVAHLRLDRTSVVLMELSGQINFNKAVGQHVQGLDGVDSPDAIDFKLRLTLDPDWEASLELTSPGGFLWRTRGAPGLARNTLGGYTAFGPLLNSAVSGQASDGNIQDLGLTAGLAATLATLGVIESRSVTLYGGELVVRAGQAYLFFDAEAEVDIKAQIIETAHSIKIRQKSMGLKLDFSGGLHPVFDTSRGFDLDLSDPGLFNIKPELLADFLQPERTRMSRGSPLNLEIDMAPRIDLGLVSIDKTSVRIPIEKAIKPIPTGFGVGLHIPGLIEGSGYLKSTETEFLGSLDASLIELGLRISANLRLDKIDPDSMGLLATLGVKFPVPIPLGSTGLGIFGFLGLFGMHYQRNQGDNESVLSWYMRAGGDLKSAGKDIWKPVRANDWAFGLGALLGTLEGGFLLNLKGAVVMQLPGPQVLIFMNAGILSLPPGLEGTGDMPSLLAVIQFSPTLFSIGLSINYDITPLLEIFIPVSAQFGGPESWSVDLGTIDEMVTVKFLSVLRASGYLMIHGTGIPQFPLDPKGIYPVATGIRAGFTWGPEEIGLYLRIAAQADIGLSFNPFYLSGQMSIEGELHLFIISISASAKAKVIITSSTFFVSAEVCGEVDFFFFSVEGCVKVELGDEPPKELPTIDLVRAISLHSRSGALLPGSAVDKPVDTNLGNALVVGQPGSLPVVPIDAIPVIQMEMRPAAPGGGDKITVLGKDLQARMGGDASKPGNWIRRGGLFYRFTLLSVDVSAKNLNGSPLNPPFTAGDTPVVWWDQNPKPNGTQDTSIQMALLNRVPDATPAAALRTKNLDIWLDHRWGNVCRTVAPPIGRLWTFHQAAYGSSSSGWSLPGLLFQDKDGNGLRDLADGYFSAEPPDLLRVTEPWRTGNALADAIIQAEPARVIAGLFPNTGRALLAPSTATDILPDAPGREDLKALLELLTPNPHGAKLADSLRLQFGPSAVVRMLLFYRRDLLVDHNGVQVAKLIALTEDANGNAFNDVRFDDPGGNDWDIRVIDPFSPPNALQNSLPGEWLDPDGQWNEQVRLFIDGFAQQEAWVMLYVEFRNKPDIAGLQIGLEETDSIHPGTWGIVAAEVLSQAEFERADFDQTVLNSSLGDLKSALTANRSSDALLRPNAIYTINVNYNIQVTQAGDDGQPKLGKDDIQSPDPQTRTQSFTFQTDNKPPDNLEPYILGSDPGADTPHFFWGDPLRVIFASSTVLKLFDTYEKELSVVVRPARGTPDQGNNSSLIVKVTEAGLKPLPPLVVTPWESAVRSVVDCLPADQDISRHLSFPINVPLDPVTNYVLDVTTDTDPANVAKKEAMYRRNFTTSRYKNMQAMAAHVSGTPVQHRFLEDVSALTILGDGGGADIFRPVQAIDIENALRSARWGDLALVHQPRVTVIWSGSQPFQPAALLIATPEPLWNFRPVPIEVETKEGDTIWKHYQMAPSPMLQVLEDPTSGGVVKRLVYAPGQGITLVVLKPASRGSHLILSLNRCHDQFYEVNNQPDETARIVDVILASAPWEVTE